MTRGRLDHQLFLGSRLTVPAQTEQVASEGVPLMSLDARGEILLTYGDAPEEHCSINVCVHGRCLSLRLLMFSFMLSYALCP